jgi:phosphoadenosine phosphosulfate reductase
MALFDLHTGSIVANVSEPTTVLEPTADGAALEAAAAAGGAVALRFLAFGDGRGYSLAVLLRERHGFTGEIRAVGYMIPDLAPFLLRSGFDTAEVADEGTIGTWKAALTRLRHAYQPGLRNPQPLRWNASKKEADELSNRLSRIKNLADRIREMRRRVEGRIVFSTNLGLEDQAILHAIADSGADIDVFTLDTGRLFPEVLETAEISEIRYGIRIRLVAPEAREVEALVARDGVFGFKNSVENRKACCEVRKVRPLSRELKGAPALRSPDGTTTARSSRSIRSPTGRPRTSPPTSPPTTYRSTRCTRVASSQSAAPRAPAPCCLARTRAPGAGGGSTRRRRSAACI